MSSQVPTTHDVAINSIAFDGHLYSLHPTSLLSNRNVGDVFLYKDGVSILQVGGRFDDNAKSGIFTFHVASALSVSGTGAGSSGTRTATNSSINVGDIYGYQSGVRLLRAGGCYDNATNGGPLTFHVYEPLTYSYANHGSSGTRQLLIVL